MSTNESRLFGRKALLTKVFSFAAKANDSQHTTGSVIPQTTLTNGNAMKEGGLSSYVKIFTAPLAKITPSLLYSAKILLVSILCSLMSIGSIAWADAPGVLNYQGKLTDQNGNPLTGPYDIEFNIYDDPISGSSLFTESRSAVPVENGVFNVQIGSSTATGIPKSVFQGGTARYLGVKVGLDDEMTPRERLLAAPYAIAVATDSVGTAEIVNETIMNADISPSADISANKINGGSFQSEVYTFPSGLNLSGGTVGAANTLDFGNGANDDLTNVDVSSLTYGGVTSLHTHSGLTPGTHASTHYAGDADSIEAGYVSTGTVQTINAAKTFTGGVAVNTNNLTVGAAIAANGNLTVGDGSGPDSLSFNGTGAYLALPTAVLTTAGQIRYNSGALVYRDGSSEVTVSSATHTHGGLVPGAHASTHYAGDTDSIAAGYVSTGTVQTINATKTFTSSVTLSGVDLYVGGNQTLVGDLTLNGGNVNFGAATTIGDGGDALTINSNGTLTVDDNLTVNTDLNVNGGNVNFGAATTIGDAGDAIRIDSNGTLTIADTNITGTGALTVMTTGAT
ncbi:MAG TPA: hypothetical protein PK876_05775, partial [Elusimicrobiota bacterium]|nr:hypothetical protein [Elusimicrobiota bacterium]